MIPISTQVSEIAVKDEVGCAVLPEIGDDELLSAIQNEILYASEGYDERRENRETAVKYFNGELPAPPCEEDLEIGMSDIVSTDVADAVYAVASEIIPSFADQAPVEFVPNSKEDEEQAALETRAVTHVAANCGAFMAISNAVQDALLRRAGVLKIYWEERKHIDYKKIDERLDMLPNIIPKNAEFAEATVDQLTGRVRGTLKIETIKSKPRIDAVPLDEFLISTNVTSPDLSDARFMCHQRPISRSELVELGMSPEDAAALPAYTWNANPESVARNRALSGSLLRTGHESNEYVMASESYYHIDRDGDGIAELRRVLTAGGIHGADRLVSDEPWGYSPFAVGVGYLGLYTWDGKSLFDRLKGIQDAKTESIRTTLDTNRRNMRQRIGVVERDGNPNDVLNSAMGGTLRAKTPQGYFAIPDPKVPPESIPLLEYLDTMRADKGGSAIDTAARPGKMGNDTAQGTERIMASFEQTTAMIARNLCETMIKPMYRTLHRLMMQYHTDPVQIPGSTGWESVSPGEWGPREKMLIGRGMSVGERGRRMAALDAIQKAQTATVASGLGGILVSPDEHYRALIDFAMTAGLQNPEQYWLNPQSQESQAAKAKKEQESAQQKQMAQQQQAMQAEFQYKLLTDVERIKADSKRQSDAMRSEIESLKAHLKHTEAMFGHRVDLAQVQAGLDETKAEGAVDLLQTKASAQ